MGPSITGAGCEASGSAEWSGGGKAKSSEARSGGHCGLAQSFTYKTERNGSKQLETSLGDTGTFVF